MRAGDSRSDEIEAHRKLLRALLDSLDSGNLDAFQGVGRLLDILGDRVPAGRIVPSLARLFRHPDPFIRSKAVLLVGRANRSARWSVRRLNDPDTRIRASALEGLWGMQGDDVREVMRTAANDPNNRVAGNALLGLYQLGEVSSIADIQAMASSSSTLFRATAAWVMGETKSPRFRERLAGMLGDSSPMVRKRAFAALRKTKDASTVPPAAEWQVAARGSVGDTNKGTRRILLSVMADSRQQPTILGTEFLLTENGRAILSYKVAVRNLPDSLAVVFLFPKNSEWENSPWLEGALRCVKWKRATDFWACEWFSRECTSRSMQQDRGPNFQSTAVGVDAELRSHPQKGDGADVWHSMRRVLLGESGVRGRCHVILFNPSRSHGVADDELLAAFSSRGSLQAISMVPDPAIETLCAHVHGIFELARSPEQVPDLITRAYLRLLARYELSYIQSNADADVRVEVRHPQGGGEARVIIPARGDRAPVPAPLTPASSADFRFSPLPVRSHPRASPADTD